MNIFCAQCKATESALWRPGKNKEDQICNDCFEKEKQEMEKTPEPELNPQEETQEQKEKTTRKSVRTTRYKSQVSKGKCNRRNLFKKQPFKTPKISAETQTKDSLFYEVC
jgi:hypothetical protein